MRKIPAARVPAASKPANPAGTHFRRRAHQKARRDVNKKRDSLYGDRKKKLTGKAARRISVRRAISVENSALVKAKSTVSAPKNAMLETTSAASSVPMSWFHVRARIVNG